MDMKKTLFFFFFLFFCTAGFGHSLTSTDSTLARSSQVRQSDAGGRYGYVLMQIWKYHRYVEQ